VISPAKLQNAAASIDRIGEEGSVLRTTFVVSLVITAVCALILRLLIWSQSQRMPRPGSVGASALPSAMTSACSVISSKWPQSQ
jgi:hypothetical protein